MIETRFSSAEFARIPEKHRPAPNALVTRSRMVEIEMPMFTKVANREAVIFEAAESQTSGAGSQ
jgi:hypothetical protein